MKLIFAPDSFKGSISAVRITELLTARAKVFFKDAECVSLPVADGGEGTIDALTRIFGGELISETVTGPMGETVAAQYAKLPGGRAVIEMAQASGLTLVPPAMRNPLGASSYGFGELIARALDAGLTELIIGIGGSATNDGGMGLLRALGARFYDAGGHALKGTGADLSLVSKIDLNNLHPALAHAKLTVLSDVTNPLWGESGATRVYGPQKGADERALEELERGMRVYARAFMDQHGLDIADFPGAGAAGGAGAALAGVMHAQIRRGIDAVLDMADFDSQLAGAALVITGEGRIDGQTARFGKVPAGVLRRAARAGVPCAILAGGVGADAEAIYEIGDAMIFPIVDAPMTLNEAMRRAEALIVRAADSIFWAFGAGMRDNTH